MLSKPWLAVHAVSGGRPLSSRASHLNPRTTATDGQRNASLTAVRDANKSTILWPEPGPTDRPTCHRRRSDGALTVVWCKAATLYIEPGRADLPHTTRRRVFAHHSVQCDASWTVDRCKATLPPARALCCVRLPQAARSRPGPRHTARRAVQVPPPGPRFGAKRRPPGRDVLLRGIAHGLPMLRAVSGVPALLPGLPPTPIDAQHTQSKNGRLVGH